MSRSCLTGVFFLFFLAANSQSLDTVKFKNQYLSIQANQLIRQLLNFGGNSGSVLNPFLINYSSNNISTGNGINFGLGYLVSNTSDGDSFNERKTKGNDFNFRLGYDYKKHVAQKVIVGYGLDVVIQSMTNKTSNITRFDANQRTEIKTINKDIGWGLGPRLTLIYQFNQNIAIGTEASYYFKSVKSTNEINTFSRFQSFNPITGQTIIQTNSDEEKSDSKNAQFRFDQPAVIYLIYQF